MHMLPHLLEISIWFIFDRYTILESRFAENETDQFGKLFSWHANIYGTPIIELFILREGETKHVFSMVQHQNISLLPFPFVFRPRVAASGRDVEKDPDAFCLYSMEKGSFLYTNMQSCLYFWSVITIYDQR